MFEMDWEKLFNHMLETACHERKCLNERQPSNTFDQYQIT